MINDEIFRVELDGYLKQLGHKKSERNKLVATAMIETSIYERDQALEEQRKAANEYIKSKQIPSEASEQMAFIEWFDTEYPNIGRVLIRNDGGRSPREKIEQLNMGLCKGAADLYIPYWHVWIEFKKRIGGVISQEQRDFEDHVVYDCGDHHFYAYGCEDGKNKLLLLINSLQNQALCD